MWYWVCWTFLFDTCTFPVQPVRQTVKIWGHLILWKWKSVERINLQMLFCFLSCYFLHLQSCIPDKYEETGTGFHFWLIVLNIKNLHKESTLCELQNKKCPLQLFLHMELYRFILHVLESICYHPRSSPSTDLLPSKALVWLFAFVPNGDHCLAQANLCIRSSLGNICRIHVRICDMSLIYYETIWRYTHIPLLWNHCIYTCLSQLSWHAYSLTWLLISFIAGQYTICYNLLILFQNWQNVFLKVKHMGPTSGHRICTDYPWLGGLTEGSM